MVGHHRIKAGAESASTAVDFVEQICGDVDGDFPFDVVTRQFGPAEGDRVSIGHGKPAGHVIDLGPGEVTERGADGKLTVEREMSSHGTYDALGTDRAPGDVATTKFEEGRWWYPTVYRNGDTAKGTYVNICTPVEVFPDEIRYVDLHVDVIKRPDGTVERVDDDELTAAVEVGRIPAPLAEKARTVASAVENAL
jgi:Ribonuclease G/E